MRRPVSVRSVNSRSLRLDAAGGQLDVLGAQRVLDVLHRELARRERLAIEPDAHRVATLAADADLRDARARPRSDRRDSARA